MPLPPIALQLPKAGCPSPPSLRGCFPPCSVLLRPAGTAPSHTNPEVSVSCHPLCHSRFLSHTGCFLCVWQLHPRGVTVGESAGMEELRGCWLPGLQAPALGCFWDTCAFGTGGALACAQPCFSKSLAWPLVPPALRVTSACDPWACFEANVGLCHTWDTVLACVGVFIRTPRVSFCAREAQPLSQQHRHLCTKMLCLCFPWEQRVQNISIWQEVHRIQECQSTATSRRRQPEFE